MQEKRDREKSPRNLISFPLFVFASLFWFQTRNLTPILWFISIHLNKSSVLFQVSHFYTGDQSSLIDLSCKKKNKKRNDQCWKYVLIHGEKRVADLTNNSPKIHFSADHFWCPFYVLFFQRPLFGFLSSISPQIAMLRHRRLEVGIELQPPGYYEKTVLCTGLESSMLFR